MRRPEVGFIALAMLVSSCSVPTEMPNWDVQWNLPVNVNDMGIDITNVPLPSGITIDSVPGTGGFVRTGFTASVSALPAISRTLGAQCPGCPTATAPKPAFTAPPATTTVSLAAGSSLQTATLLGGSQIAVTVVNGFSFDPINPPGGTPGSITIAVNNGTSTIGTLTLVGPTNTIPAGATRNFTIPMSGTINTASPITVTMTMDSPAGAAGQPVTMSPSHTFTVTPTATIRISTATVSIAAAALDPETSDMDLCDMGDMGNRVEASTSSQGAMILSVLNPLSIGANATLTFTGTKYTEGGCESGPGVGFSRPMNTIVKNVVLPTGGSTTPATIIVNFTGNELREMLGSTMTATFGGSTTAGTTAVTPTSRVTMTSRMRVRLFVKEIEQ